MTHSRKTTHNRSTHTMQAIRTHYLAPTNYRGARVKAQCRAGSYTQPWDHGVDEEGNHKEVVHSLIAMLIKADESLSGTPPKDNPWSRPFVSGCLPDGSWAHVFLPKP